jgi:O-antigen ligase
MTTTQEPAPRTLVLTWALGLYAVTTLVSMAVMSVGAGIAAFGLLYFYGGPRPIVEAFATELKRIESKRYLIAASALAAACVLSLLVAKFFPLGYGGRVSQVHLLSNSAKLWYLFWPIPLVVGLRALAPEGRTRVLQAWLLAFGLLAVIGIAQFWTGWPRPQFIPESPTHFHTTLFLGFHLTVASLLIFPCFVALDLARGSFGKGPARRVLGGSFAFWTALSTAGLIALFLTYSRTLWVALPIGLIVWGMLSLPRRGRWALAVALLVLAGAATQIPSMRSRFSWGGAQYSIVTREDLWLANLAMLRDRPVTGVGWQHNQELSGYYLMETLHKDDVFSGHAHNNILDVLGGTGALGFVAWVFWCAVVLRLAWRLAWKKSPSGIGAPFGAGLFSAWIVFHVNGLTQVNFWDAKVTHQMMWVTAWLLLAGETE